MRKYLPLVLALVVFVIALVLLRPAPSATVLVATRDLRAGQILQAEDVTLQAVPAGMLPGDAISDPAQVVGQPLRLDRGQGDVVRASHLGDVVQLQANERAIAVAVTDGSGLAGMLYPGQLVGAIVTIPKQGDQYAYVASAVDGGASEDGTFSKAAVEGLRVLYVDPRWAASQTVENAEQLSDPGMLALGGVTTMDRANSGAVILAVPTDLQTVFYDFASAGAPSEQRVINALELLAAATVTDGATITLYLMPSSATTFTSPGLWLPDLIVTPAPTPTATPGR